MTQIAFDYRAAVDQINQGPTVSTKIFMLGRHVVSLEKVETIWHMHWNGKPDYVFRVFIDGNPKMEHGDHAFVRPLMGVHRQILGPIVFTSKPKWLPRDVTKQAADAAFDAAMLAAL